MEAIEVDIEEPSEFLFHVKVEGAERTPAKVRMVCESGDVSYMFNGHSTNEGLVQFNLPVMKDKLNEGTYSSRVEVLIDNRYFAPVNFNVAFKRKVKVVAEVVSVPQKPIQKQEIKVSATPVVKTLKEAVQNKISDDSLDLFFGDE